MKYIKIFLVIIAFTLSSCRSQYEKLLLSDNVQAKYKEAMRLFDAHKYQKAAGLFESLAMLTTGTEKDDTVLFYWGLSNYKFDDYYSAEANFNKFITYYPSSPFTEEARFLKLDCLYKQTLRYELDPNPTYKAITAINEFVTDYPQSKYTEDCFAMLNNLGDRLDKKAYEAARLYYLMEDYKASIVAFRNIIRDDPTNVYREEVLYYLAMSSYKFAKMSIKEKRKERYLTFVDDYYNFISEYPDSKYVRELKVMYARAQKALGKYVGQEELLEDRKIDFEKERKNLNKK